MENMNRKPAILYSDNSVSTVKEKLGGSLNSYPAACALGFECISGMSGFEAENFQFKHCMPDVWTIVAITSGEGNVKFLRQDIKAGSGTVYVIPPGIVFHERNSGKSEWGFVCLLLRLKKGSSPPFRQNRPFHVDGGFSIVGKMKEIVRALHFRPSGFEMQVLGGTIMVIGEIIGKAKGKLSVKGSDAVAKAVEIIRQNLNEPLDIPFIAGECNVSISLLAHRFKEEMGCSPMQFARRERIVAAKELFLSGCTVGEAASRLGYKNPFHLSRLFTQIEGVSPMSFRKMSRFKSSPKKKKT